MMDIGLSINQAKEFIEMNSKYTDIIKLGFGTESISANINQKIELYHNAGLKVYLGGTLFEAFIIRNMYNEYKDLITETKLENFNQYNLIFKHKNLSRKEITNLKSLAYFKFYFNFKKIIQILKYFIKSKYLRKNFA